MPPRSDEPRRDPTGARRGSSRDAGSADGESRTPEPGIGGISGARAYTPRGRTVREERGTPTRAGGAEQRRTPRSTRAGDPFRPALQVLDGGRAAARAGSTAATRRPGYATVPRPDRTSPRPVTGDGSFPGQNTPGTGGAPTVGSGTVGVGGDVDSPGTSLAGADPLV
ncbi:hypothetical protein LADH09A_000086, partial [Micromonospora sp. LAH09]|nr:hypothetical protein [Micromonospora cabrerizensis]